MSHPPVSPRSPDVSPQLDPDAQQPQLLPGQFAIQTFLKETFLTAVGGGGRTADAVATDAKEVGAWEMFNLWVYPTRVHTHENPEGFIQYAIQTKNGNYITVVGGGGRSADVLHTDAVQARAWERFGLIHQSPEWSLRSIYPSNYDTRRDSPWYYAIPASTGNYLTALGGGGHNADSSINSDATQIASWELFRLIKCGQLMSGYQYAIRPVEGIYTMMAADGGGRIRYALGFALINLDRPAEARKWAKLALIEQDDGSYAMQTVNGNYVTAVGGGGIPPLDPVTTGPSDVFHTDAVHVQSWEKFEILDQGDGTYAIQTFAGNYIGQTENWLMRTDITAIEDAGKYRLSPLLSEN